MGVEVNLSYAMSGKGIHNALTLQLSYVLLVFEVKFPFNFQLYYPHFCSYVTQVMAAWDAMGHAITISFNC